MDLVLALLAAQVLHGWDDQRAAAYAASDPAALHALYVPGSPAGRADVRLLRRYDARGLVVGRLVTQVLELSVVSSSPGTFELRVVDRVAGGTLSGRAESRPLGTTAPTLRVLTFRRIAGEWRVLSVREPGPRAAPSARPGR